MVTKKKQKYQKPSRKNIMSNLKEEVFCKMDGHSMLQTVLTPFFLKKKKKERKTNAHRHKGN